MSPATPYISHFFGFLERSVGWQILLVHKSPPHICLGFGVYPLPEGGGSILHPIENE